MHEPESPKSREVVHETYVVDGIERSTISDLDTPYIVDDAVRVALGPHIDETFATHRQQRIADHNAILERFTENTDGVNSNNVRRFVSRWLGDRQKDLRFLNSDDINWIIQVAKRNYRVVEDGVMGAYLPDADITLVRRGTEREQLNPGQAEVDAVHEQAHSYGTARWVIDSDGNLQFEQGFGPRSAFEEGWACYFGGQYASQELGRGRMVLAIEDMDARLEKHRTWRRVTIDGEQKLEKRVELPGAYAAVILERLIEHDPRIFALMRGARFDSAMFEELKVRIEKVQPGLFDQLRAIQAYKDPEASAKLTRLYDNLDHALTPRSKRIASKVTRKLAAKLIG